MFRTTVCGLTKDENVHEFTALCRIYALPAAPQKRESLSSLMFIKKSNTFYSVVYDNNATKAFQEQTAQKQPSGKTEHKRHTLAN